MQHRVADWYSVSSYWARRTKQTAVKLAVFVFFHPLLIVPQRKANLARHNLSAQLR